MRFLSFVLGLFLSLSINAEPDQLKNGLYAKINTTKGEIIISLKFTKTPLTVINFVGLADGTKSSNKKLGTPFYDGLKFHRVIKKFMIQGGDPKGNGSGGPGYKFTDEITDLKHDKPGILSMANSGPNTNGSQFFITHLPTPHLDGKHTVFGEVVKGQDVVNKIKKDDLIKTVKIIRIGKAAKKFKTDQAAFEVVKVAIKTKQKAKEKAQKVEIKKEFNKFIKQKYPKSKATKDGYYVQIDQQGKGDKVQQGKLVKAYLSVDTADGKNLRKSEPALEFVIGQKGIIKLINDIVSEMKIGEKRTIIATFHQVYGDIKKFQIIPKKTIFIFKVELIFIGDDKTPK